VSSRPVAWASFLRYADSDNAKFSRDWLLTPANVTTAFRDGSPYCRLCDSYFSGRPADHVAVHAEELDAFLASRRAAPLERSHSAVDHDHDERVRELHAQGASQRAISETLGISRRRVRGILDETPRERARLRACEWATPRDDLAPAAGSGPLRTAQDAAQEGGQG